MKNEEGEGDEDDEDKMESDDEEEIKPTEPMTTGIQHLSKDLTYVFSKSKINYAIPSRCIVFESRVYCSTNPEQRRQYCYSWIR